jgi:hypothetical protein
VATVVELHAGDLEMQILDLGLTTDSPQKLVEFLLRPVLANQLEHLFLALAVL